MIQNSSTRKFRVTQIIDKRNWGSSLVIGKTYEGLYTPSNNCIWWTDPANYQEWVFWVGDTCELVN
jgi:hypothetical protein